MLTRLRPSILFLLVGLVVVALAGGFALHTVLAGQGGPGSPRPTAPPAARPRVSLAGRVVVLDPGHNGGNGDAAGVIDRQVPAGGFDKPCDTVGAQTDSGYPEHAFTFDVAQRTAALLRSRGATVVLTRSSDTGVGPCVDERARIGNRAGADAAVSVHADGGPPGGRGFHVIEPAISPDGANAAILAPSARLAASLRSAFGRDTGEPRADYLGTEGMTSRSDLGGLNLSRVPKIFVECANMRNRTDAARVSDPVWRQRAAIGLADGITAFLTAGDAPTPAAKAG